MQLPLEKRTRIIIALLALVTVVAALILQLNGHKGLAASINLVGVAIFVALHFGTKDRPRKEP